MKMLNSAKGVLIKLQLVIAAFAICGNLHAAGIIDDIEANTHLGPATCATSQCHGKSAPVEGRNVHLDEYTFWIDQDYHSVSFRTLENDESKAIARKLGLESARTAGICLDCHADNVPVEKRGPKFTLSDGVGCEACHGGAEKWITTHTEKGQTHENNVAQGLIETEKGDVRAELCLSCHLGTKDKFATHRIMAAGHPKLTFEMNLFTTNQPAHYSVDQDYIDRKGMIPGFNLWMSGQFESAKQQVSVATGSMFDGPGIFPDFAFYDCDSCHHSTNNLRWTSKRADGLEPGSLRMHLPNLVVLDSLMRAVGKDGLATAVNNERKKALVAAQRGESTFNKAAASFLNVLESASAEMDREYSGEEVRAVRRALLQAGAEDRASDFAEYEQVIYSFETLCETLGDMDKCLPVLDQFYDTVKQFDNYNPRQFSKVAKSAVKQF